MASLPGLGTLPEEPKLDTTIAALLPSQVSRAFGPARHVAIRLRVFQTFVLADVPAVDTASFHDELVVQVSRGARHPLLAK
ncbi:hypothetical protein PYCC9005_003517 [Savitreella phatthalungensis]